MNHKKSQLRFETDRENQSTLKKCLSQCHLEYHEYKYANLTTTT